MRVCVLVLLTLQGQTFVHVMRTRLPFEEKKRKAVPHRRIVYFAKYTFLLSCQDLDGKIDSFSGLYGKHETVISSWLA